MSDKWLFGRPVEISQTFDGNSVAFIKNGSVLNILPFGHWETSESLSDSDKLMMNASTYEQLAALTSHKTALNPDKIPLNGDYAQPAKKAATNYTSTDETFNKNSALSEDFSGHFSGHFDAEVAS